MSKRDWIEVGLKLLGVYFLILGFATAVLTGVGFVGKSVMIIPRACWQDHHRPNLRSR